jgi:hypothetical protein
MISKRRGYWCNRRINTWSPWVRFLYRRVPTGRSDNQINCRIPSGQGPGRTREAMPSADPHQTGSDRLIVTTSGPRRLERALEILSGVLLR